MERGGEKINMTKEKIKEKIAKILMKYNSEATCNDINEILLLIDKLA